MPERLRTRAATALASVAALVVGFVGGTAISNEPTDKTLTYLSFSTNSDRSNAKVLHDAAVPAPAYIFLNEDKDNDVVQADFYVNQVYGGPLYGIDWTEKFAPFDLLGTNAQNRANPIQACKQGEVRRCLAPGKNLVLASLTFKDGHKENAAAVFNLDTPPPVSTTTTTAPPTGVVYGPRVAHGLQVPQDQLTTINGNLDLRGETRDRIKVTGTVKGYGKITNSLLLASGSSTGLRAEGGELVIEDSQVGSLTDHAERGGVAIGASGQSRATIRRSDVLGWSDCFRNGPFLIEDSRCELRALPGDHNDGYQAYCGTSKSGNQDNWEVVIRYSEIIFPNDAHVTAGIFHADYCEALFTLENLKIRVPYNYCIRLHSAASDGVPPELDGGRVRVMRNIDCAGGGAVWVKGMPVDIWENVMVSGVQQGRP